MAHYFIDPSALLKRYIHEEGSDRVRSLVTASSTETIFVAEIALAEIAAAIAAKHRAPGGISDGMRRRILARFLLDCNQHYVIVTTQRSIIDRAVQLSQNHRLRGYDAVQLATALSVRTAFAAQDAPLGLIFVASDGDLLDAASVEGLRVTNPAIQA